jgi:hypothetical protein
MLRRNFLGAVPVLCLVPFVLPKHKNLRKHFPGHEEAIKPRKIRWKLMAVPINFANLIERNEFGLKLATITYSNIYKETHYTIISYSYENRSCERFTFDAEYYDSPEKIEKQKKVLEEQWGFDPDFEYIHLQYDSWNCFTRIEKSKLYIV